MLKKLFFAACIVFCLLPGWAHSATIFLADFEEGYDAAFAGGSPEALFGVRLPEGGAKLAEGRFGQGLFLEKEAGPFQFGYETAGNFIHEQGTVEFWFRPEWEMGYQGPERPQERWYSSFTLFSTLEAPTGFRLQKNQYNYLSYHFWSSYRTYASVGLPARTDLLEKGNWSHVAASWDGNEGRLFVDGRLIAVSDFWDVSTPYEHRMFLSGWGTFDDFRVSDRKIYVSSFPVPDKPLTVQERAVEPAPPELSPEEKKQAEKEGLIFYVDFSEGLTAKIAGGVGSPVTNRPIQVEGPGGAAALRLERTGVLPETTVCYPASGNISPFLGTAEIVFRLSGQAEFPLVLLDMSEIEQQAPPQAHQRTGMRLILNDNRELEWQNLFAGRGIASVNSGPLQLDPDGWNRLGFTWKPSSVGLLQEDRVLVEKNQQPLPVKLSNYIFIGSDSLSAETLDGWVKEVKIMLNYGGGQ